VVKGGTNQIALIGSSFASLSVSVEDSQDDPMLVVDAVVLFTAPATDAKRRFRQWHGLNGILGKYRGSGDYHGLLLKKGLDIHGLAMRPPPSVTRTR